MMDYRGTPILPGSQVAYNLSGFVATGVVLETKERGAMRKKPLILIKPDYEWDNRNRTSGISRITHPCNLVVLKSTEVPDA